RSLVLTALPLHPRRRLSPDPLEQPRSSATEHHHFYRSLPCAGQHVALLASTPMMLIQLLVDAWRSDSGAAAGADAAKRRSIVDRQLLLEARLGDYGGCDTRCTR
ncbi:unnamed protein product, partial [Ectocarpus sp. 12 AP-2014]